MTGGYKIIDLEGLDLANIQLDSTKIEKIFSDIESTYKTKALLFDNYNIKGIEQNATFSSAIVKNSGFEITLGDYKILIKNDSVVDNTPHLYRHDVELYIYDKELLNTYYLYFSIYSNIKENATNYNELFNITSYLKTPVAIDSDYHNNENKMIKTLELVDTSVILEFVSNGIVSEKEYSMINVGDKHEATASSTATKIF